MLSIIVCCWVKFCNTESTKDQRNADSELYQRRSTMIYSIAARTRCCYGGGNGFGWKPSSAKRGF